MINKHQIDYKQISQHVDEMINLLEYDSMRSPGKCKLNAPAIDSLYNLQDRYSAMAQDDTSTRKKAKAVAKD